MESIYSDQTKIDISELAKGIYFVETNYNQVFKLIVE